MIVNYFGDGCFRLQSGDVSLLVNPSNNRLKADITLRTISPADVVERDAGEITMPGEYEAKDIEIRGIPLLKESTAKYVKTIYAVAWEGIRFAFLGHLSRPLDAEAIEALGEPDVLFIPTDHEHFISADDAAKLVKQLNPGVIIPAYEKNANAFLRALGQKEEPMEKFVFKRKDLEGMKGKVVVLESKYGS